jgi:hypothetical protein
MTLFIFSTYALEGIFIPPEIGVIQYQLKVLFRGMISIFVDLVQ